jgi:hypothetical protein
MKRNNIGGVWVRSAAALLGPESECLKAADDAVDDLDAVA